MDKLVCPKCGSIEITRPKKLPLKERMFASIKYYSVQEIYSCMNCNYLGQCPIIDEKDLDAFKDHIKQNKNTCEE